MADIYSNDPRDRGFDPGDDDKIQAAIRANLKQAVQDNLTDGDTDEAERVKGKLEALEEIAEIDKKLDPQDRIPDNEIG